MDTGWALIGCCLLMDLRSPLRLLVGSSCQLCIRLAVLRLLQAEAASVDLAFHLRIDLDELITLGVPAGLGGLWGTPSWQNLTAALLQHELRVTVDVCLLQIKRDGFALLRIQAQKYVAHRPHGSPGPQRLGGG